MTRQGATTIVTQGTNQGIIDWRSFSIGPQESVRFDQPGRSSVTLNRVTSSEISRIDGNLSATGQVWLSNPNGVMIGAGGQVNVGGLLATTGRVDAAEFLRSGRASIDQIAKDSAIVNSGTVNIQAGGYAALAAAAIRNDGVIAARSGSVALGSGKAMTVDFVGDKLITFQVTQPLDQAPSGADALITASGAVIAEGGAVLMSARAAKGVMDSVINLKGHVVAKSVTVDGGTVRFGDGGIVQVSGRIDASDAVGQGGSVAILGEKVGLMDGASIDASGASGGGAVLVGGDWQGQGPAHNAQVAYVAATASINADATANGSGGKVVVWSDDTTRFNGTISARGGATGGDGGRVETSGKHVLDVGRQASVDMKARGVGAKPGAWLLDPSDITIVATGGAPLTGQIFDPSGVAGSISTSTIQAGLAGGAVTIQTVGGSTGLGDITWTGGMLTYGGAASALILKADRNIDFQSGAHIVSTANNLDVTFEARAQGGANGSVKLDGTITTHGGNVVLGGPAGGLAIGGGGPLLTGVSINGTGLVNAAGGNIIIKGQGAANAPGVVISGQVKTAGSGVITIDGSSPSASLSVSHGVTISGAVLNAGDGAINITGGSLNAASGSSGVMVTGTVANTGGATGLGAITLTGTRGQGGGVNILVASGTLYTGGGNLVLDGSYASGGLAGSSPGIRLSAATLSTTNGAIQLTGVGNAAGGSTNHGILIDPNTVIAATGTGDITLTGTRGDGQGSFNIAIQGASSGLASITTVTGSLTLNGAATTAFSPYASVDGVYMDYAKVQTSDGVIAIAGKSGATGLAGNGISIYRSTIWNIGTSTTLGQVRMIGNANGAAGNDIYFETATSTGGNRSLIIGGDSFGVGPGATSFTGGKTAFQPRTSGLAIVVDGVTSAGTLGLANMIALTSGSIEVGSGSAGAITTNGALMLTRDFSFVSGSGPIVFNSTVNDATSTHTLSTSTTGIVTFGGSVGAISALGAAVFSGLAAPSVDNTYSFKVAAAAGSSFGGGLGTASLRFTSVSVIGATSMKGTFFTTNGQNYGGAVVVAAGGATIQAGGLANFGGTINSIGVTSLQSLSVNAGSASFGGAIGGSAPLSDFSVSVTNTGLTLPSVTAQNISLSTGSGSIIQGGALLVSNQTTINTTTGFVTLTHLGNDINKLAVTSTNANVSVHDDVGTLEVTQASLGGGVLLLKGANSIIQSGAISAPTLSVTNADIVTLNNSSNVIANFSGSLSGSNQFLTLTNSYSSGLTLGAVTAKTVNVTQTGGGPLTLNGAVNAATSADISASTGTLSFAGAGALYTPTAALGGGAISAGSAVAISITNAPLTLYGSTGTLNNVTVNGSANPVAAGRVTLSTTGGSMVINGVTLNGPSAAVPPATPASQASVASVVSVASVATVASVPSVQSTQSIASIASVATVPTQPVATVISLPEAGGGVLNQILTPVVKFDPPPPIPPQTQPNLPPGNPSAQSLVAVVTATQSGALVPQGPSVVGGTGATLASAPTIKVDAADSGGGNGQVIAAGVGSEFGGAPNVLPGLLRDDQGGGRRVKPVEPPLAQQPSQINDEAFLD